MNNSLFIAMMTCIFVSCSSDGSCEMQIDELDFVSSETIDRGSDEYDYSKMKSIFEVVPGKYEISWRLIDKVPQLKNYDVALHLKLRLKRHVDVLPSVFERITNNTKNPGYIPFAFYFADADGKIETASSYAQIDELPLDLSRKTGEHTNRDALLDFMNFLNSDPGTEVDFVAHSIGCVSSVFDEIENIKNARKIILSNYLCDDKRFERDYGKIE